MKRRFSPQQKKRWAYDRDHVTLGWNSASSFRKAWRKKESAAQRAYRRAWKVALHETTRSDHLDGADPGRGIRRRQLQKAKPPCVRELVARKLEWRRSIHRRKATSARYQAEQERWMAESFLRDLLQRRSVKRMERLRNIEAFVVDEARAAWPCEETVLRHIRRFPVWQVRLRTWRRELLERKGWVRKKKASDYLRF